MAVYITPGHIFTRCHMYTKKGAASEPSYEYAILDAITIFTVFQSGLITLFFHRSCTDPLPYLLRPRFWILQGPRNTTQKPSDITTGHIHVWTLVVTIVPHNWTQISRAHIFRGISGFFTTESTAVYDVFHSNNFFHRKWPQSGSVKVCLSWFFMVLVDWWLINESWRIHKCLPCLTCRFIIIIYDLIKPRNFICVFAVSRGMSSVA